jgi:ATP-dependent DNA helicase
VQDVEDRLARLQHLLDKSTFYANALKEMMDAAKARSEHVVTKPPPTKTKKRAAKRNGKKRSRDDDQDDEPAKRAKLDEDGTRTTKFIQPALITGATLKDYQLEGVEWMISLDQNGISGILGAFHSVVSHLLST